MNISLPLSWARRWDRQQDSTHGVDFCRLRQVDTSLTRDSDYNTPKFQPSYRWLERVALTLSRGYQLTCS